MASIVVHTKTKCPATLRMANELRSFLFEQQYGELERYYTEAQRRHLTAALKAMTKVYTKFKE